MPPISGLSLSHSVIPAFIHQCSQHTYKLRGTDLPFLFILLILVRFLFFSVFIFSPLFPSLHSFYYFYYLPPVSFSLSHTHAFSLSSSPSFSLFSLSFHLSFHPFPVCLFPPLLMHTCVRMGQASSPLHLVPSFCGQFCLNSF